MAEPEETTTLTLNAAGLRRREEYLRDLAEQAGNASERWGYPPGIMQEMRERRWGMEFPPTPIVRLPRTSPTTSLQALLDEIHELREALTSLTNLKRGYGAAVPLESIETQELIDHAFLAETATLERDHERHRHDMLLRMHGYVRSRHAERRAAALASEPRPTKSTPISTTHRNVGPSAEQGV